MGTHSATLLANGKVLVDGGTPRLYDPDSGTWTATGHMDQLELTRPRCCPMAGCSWWAANSRAPRPQLYDPDTGSWTATADMRERHQSHDGDHHHGHAAER